MKVLSLKKNPLNIQKCLLPDCEFLRKNHGRYCVIAENKCKVIVKIGLCEMKNISEILFLDESVSLFSSFEGVSKMERLKDVAFENFFMIAKVRIAKIVSIIVTFANFLDVKRGSFQKLKEVVRDILRFFVFCSGSVVFLHNLTENQKFGINCIFVKNVDNSKSGDMFRVDTKTQIKIENCISQLKLEQMQEKENLTQVGGYCRVYKILKETLDICKSFNSKNIKLVNKLLLIGPKGCGKTTLVHNIVRDIKCILLEISASNINTLTPLEMENKLNNIFKEAKIYTEYNECCIILIEDIDIMSSGRTLLAKRFVGLLITLLEEVDNTSGVLVIATTNSPDDVNSQLRKPKRLEDELEMMVPTTEERVEILEKILNQCKLEFEEEILHQISSWTPGFVGADLRLLVMEALILYNKKGSIKMVDQNLLKNCFSQALSKVIPSALRGAVGLCTNNNVTFSQIGGLEEIKKILDLNVKQQLENPEKFVNFGIPLTKGILLFGPPGCAKTTLVKALAKECSTTFLATSAADLYSPYVGDAEKKIIQLFTQARISSPCILFIDEIDAVVGSKSGGRESGVQERILSTLLIEMDGVGLKVNTHSHNSLNILIEEKEKKHKDMNSGVIVIGATNRPQLLDDALKRPGRFDRLLYVPPPNETERFRILKKLTEKMPLHDSVNLNILAKLTNFYSGADLKNLCQEAGLHALKLSDMSAECIHQSHFEYILNYYKPSLNQKVVSFYESFQQHNV